MALDLRGLADHVVAQALPRPGIRCEQSAQHAYRRGLAAAVWPQKTVDFAAFDLQRDRIDHSPTVEGFRQTANVYRQRSYFGHTSTG